MEVSFSEGQIFNIQRYSLHDGPGIRMTIFLKGCPLSCWWCHNPEGQYCTTETHSCVTVNELMKEIEKERIFFDESGGGVTFSGGEPLEQIEFLSAMLDECKDKGIHTSVDTSGYAESKVLESVIDKADLFLYDLKLIDNDLHKKYTGVSNKIILKNLEILKERKQEVIIRFPLIPGITDSNDNIEAVINYMLNWGGSRQINILPYHKIAEGKYLKHHIENKMTGIGNQMTRSANSIKDDFEKHGFVVKIGG